MTRYTGLIQAFDKLAEASANVALELEALDAPTAGLPPPAPVSAGGASREAPAAATSSVDEGECPKHHKAWTSGTYGPYCTAQTDDPAWAKVKPDGKMFCKITPRNAPDWLRIQAA